MEGIDPDSDMRPDRGSRKHRRGLTRSAAACERCRRRKQKCDGKTPTCTPCAAVGAGCVVSNRLVIQPECSCDMMRVRINDLQACIKSLSLQLEQVRNRGAHHVEEGAPDVQLMPWRASNEQQRLEHSTTGRELEFDSPSDPLHSIAAGIYRPDHTYVHRILRPTFTTTTQKTNLDALSSAWHLWHDDQSTQTLSQSLVGSADLPIEAYGDDLVRVFFERRWPHLPILHRPTFIEQHYKPVSEGLYPSNISRFQVYMVFAIAALENTRISKGFSLSHDDFFQLAIHDLNSAVGADDFECIQCLLLLSMYGNNEPQRVNMWYTTGLALRIAVGIDLHRKESISSTDILTAELSKRIFWSAYVMDRSTSIAMGRPLSIQDADITMPIPLQLTDDEILSGNRTSASLPKLSQNVKDTSTFIHIIKLRRINSDIYAVFHSVGETSFHDNNLEVTRQTYSERLSEWLITAPHYVLPSSTFQSSEWFQIAYHHAILSLYRPSRAIPVASTDALQLCADSSISLITSYGSLYAKNNISHTFVALHSIFMAAVTMLYSLRASPKVRQDLSKTVTEINISSCLTLFRGIANGRAIGERCSKIISRLGRATLSLFDHETTHHDEVDAEFLSWFGLRSHAASQESWPAWPEDAEQFPLASPSSMDLAWSEFFAQGFDMNGSGVIEFFP